MSSTIIFTFSAGIVVLAYLIFQFRSRGKLDIPRVGQKPGILGNTSKGHFYAHSLELIQEGYEKVSPRLTFRGLKSPHSPTHAVQRLIIFTMDYGYGSRYCLKEIHERFQFLVSIGTPVDCYDTACRGVYRYGYR